MSSPTQEQLDQIKLVLSPRPDLASALDRIVASNQSLDNLQHSVGDQTPRDVFLGRMKVLLDQNVFDSLKLQYEVTAKRYEDIYQALWQNFSFMAAAAAAILTFGRDALGMELAASLSCVPLLVWYWGTFEPLNYYGDLSASTLGNIEKALFALMGKNSATTIPDSIQMLFDEFNTKRDQQQPEKKRTNLVVAWIIGIISFAIVILARFVPPLNWVLQETSFRHLIAVLISIMAALVAALVAICVQLLLYQTKLRGLRVRTTIRTVSVMLHVVFLSLLLYLLPLRGIQTPASNPPVVAVMPPNPAGMEAVQDELARLRVEIQRQGDLLRPFGGGGSAPATTRN